MPHIHKHYDFVTSAFIVHNKKVLLVKHKRYNKWLPIGGHIELNEDPEEALYREIKEECGLKVKILSKKPSFPKETRVKPILLPHFIDVHPIKGVHKHIALIYMAISRSNKVILHEREHSEFKWLTKQELKKPTYKLAPSVKFYCMEALKMSML